MTRIETKERLMAKIINARSELGSREDGSRSQRHQRERTSPADHYYISKYAKASYNLTEWLSDLEDDPAVVVRTLLFL
jgi:hypothetical protein